MSIPSRPIVEEFLQSSSADVETMSPLYLTESDELLASEPPSESPSESPPGTPPLETLSPEPQESSVTLQKLPIEVKVRIYRYVLDINSSTSNYFKGQSVRSDIEDLPDRTALLQTSREIHREAIIEMFRSNSFLVKIIALSSENDFERYRIRLYAIKFGFFQHYEANLGYKIKRYRPERFRQQPVDHENTPIHLLKSIHRVCVEIGVDYSTVTRCHSAATTRFVRLNCMAQPSQNLCLSKLKEPVRGSDHSIRPVY